MATITLTGGTFGCSMGMGAFEGIGVAFTSAKKSSCGLSEALGTLKSKHLKNRSRKQKNVNLQRKVHFHWLMIS